VSLKPLLLGPSYGCRRSAFCLTAFCLCRLGLCRTLGCGLSSSFKSL